MFLKTLFTKENGGKCSAKKDMVRHFSYPNGHFIDVRIRIYPTTKFGFQSVVILSPLSIEGDALPMSTAFESVTAAVLGEYSLAGKQVCWIEHYPSTLFSASLTGTPYRLIEWDPNKRGTSPALQSIDRHVVEFLIGEALHDIDEVAASPHFQALVELDSVANELSYMAEGNEQGEELNQLSGIVRSCAAELTKAL
jgi:hypothetical protein